MDLPEPNETAEWLRKDLELLTSAPGFQQVSGVCLPLWRRSLADDPNHLFLWRLAGIKAPPRAVHAALTHRILDYHQHFTKEFRGGELMRELPGQGKIFYQWFDPGIPGIKKRDLCHLMVERQLDDEALLASYRSVPARPPRPGFARITWWGASLCTPGSAPGTCTLSYLDREHQGGLFPAWLMNRLMPRYLAQQRARIENFFAQGGPPELSS